MATVTTQASARADAPANRGRRMNRPRGKGPRQNSQNAAAPPAPSVPQEPTQAVTSNTTVARAESVDEDRVCWICAEEVKYYAVSECNHRTCHVCSLRLRALYKKLECTFCKVNCYHHESCARSHPIPRKRNRLRYSPRRKTVLFPSTRPPRFRSRIQSFRSSLRHRR
jgi:hypothetical protein